MKTSANVRTRAYAFSLEVIKCMKNLPKQKASWIISDQLLRSAMSIGANLHEAQSASSKLEFKKYYEISLKSAKETIYWLKLLRDSELMEGPHGNLLLDEAEQLSRMVSSAVLSIKSKL